MENYFTLFVCLKGFYYCFLKITLRIFKRKQIKFFLGCNVKCETIYYKKKKAHELLIRQLTEKIIHRGPDDIGYFIKDNISFGFNRLSIIDLECGNQPFEIEK